MGFVCVAKVSDIPPGNIGEVEVEGRTIAVANVGGQFHAIDNTCLHRGGPLGQGHLNGNVVTCPWHGWSFDVTCGKATHSEGAVVVCYPVEVRGDAVYVEVSSS